MLGHHDIGDYFWYTAFGNFSYFDFFDENGNLKPGKELRTHEEILSIITYIHESYHLVQDLTLGLAAWVHYNSDEIAISVHELAKKIPSRLSRYPLVTVPLISQNPIFQQVETLLKEKCFLHDCIYTSKITDAVLKAQIDAYPSMDHSYLDAARGLTGQDLLECHAAILTERYISGLMIRFPLAFNKAILSDIEPYFRVEAMESCQKVLELFSKYVYGIKFDRANQEHPLYPVCTRPAEYGLILFLLDYALHICPLENKGSALPPDIQDAIPTIRFLKIMGSVIPCLLELKDRSSFILNEQYLYSDFMEHLVAFNNKCNKLAGKASTFYLYQDITVKWQELWKGMVSRVNTEGLFSLFELFCEYHLKALAMTNRDLLHVYTIRDFAITLGLNPMTSTNTEVRLSMPYVIFAQGDGEGNYVILPNPYEVTDTFIGRELFKGISEMIFSGDEFKCPAAERIAFYPCQQRSNECKCIVSPGNIPQCFARQVLEDFYPEYARS